MVLNAHDVNVKVKEFHNAHGDCIYTDGWLLFQDGAQRENNPLGRLMEPPADPLKLAKKIEWYWQAKLGRAVEEFDLFKHQHMIHAKTALRQQMAQAPLGDTGEVLNHLKELQQIVYSFQHELELAEIEVEKNKPQRLKELEAQSECHREAAESLISELDNFEI